MKDIELFNNITEMVIKSKSPKMDNSHLIDSEKLRKTINEIYNKYYKPLKKENEQLKQQIEKMKSCNNCIHAQDEGCDIGARKECFNNKFSKWELFE